MCVCVRMCGTQLSGARLYQSSIVGAQLLALNCHGTASGSHYINHSAVLILRMFSEERPNLCWNCWASLVWNTVDLRGDIIEVYKYLHGYYDVSGPTFQPSLSVNLRGNSMKQRFRQDLRGNYFTVWVATHWNSLPDSVVKAPTVNVFKSRLDRHWSNLQILYNPSSQYSC